MQTIADLLKSAEPLKLATRQQIAAKLTTCEALLSPLFDNLIAVAAGIQECRALLADDDDDAVVEDASETPIEEAIDG